jgi:hypothetical protein
MSVEEAGECVRFSVGRFSDRTDVEITVAALRAAVVKHAA